MWLPWQLIVQTHSKIIMLINKLQRNIIHCISKSTDVRTCSNLYHFTFMYINVIIKLAYGLLENGWSCTLSSHPQISESGYLYVLWYHFINARKRTGPNTEPWGTPDKTLCGDEQKPFTFTCYERFIKKALIQLKRFLLIP